MQFASEHVKPKNKAEVELILNDGTSSRGNIFCNAMERLVDILNDERMFIPFEDSKGIVRLLNKSAITSISPVDQSIQRPEPIPRAIGQPSAQRSRY